MNKRFTKLIAALALLVFMTPSLAGWGQTRTEVTWTASEQGYENGTEISAVTFEANISGTFAKGTGSNAPKYYTSGAAIRCYGGNTITINSSSDNLTGITIAFGESDGSNEITSSVGSYSDGTWTGDATSVTFTIGGTSGNRRIAGFTITYGGVPTPTVATPTFNPAAGTYTEAQSVTITCTTDGATIYYTTDGEAPTTESDVYSTALNISETTTVKAMAVKESMNNSAVATAVYTIEAPAVEQTFSKISGHNPVVGQTYLIVDLNSNKALTSANGTSSAPTAVSVTIENNQITTSESALQWTFEAEEGGYVIHPVGDNAKWLYSTNSNDGVRVGTNNNKVWELDITDEANYHGFKNVATSRYIGVYNNQDWRTYTSIHNNIKETQIALFVLGEAPNDPVITASNVSIDYDATEGEIVYSIENPVAGATVAATTNVEWLTIGTVGETVPFTCTANEDGTARMATVTLSYTYGDNETVTKDVTVTQGAAPVIYTTIPALFDAATSTEKSVLVTFNNWVVSGSTNKNVFVTDNNGNGFVIFDNDGGLTDIYTAGDILSGTAVSCTLKKYNGFAELLNVNATDLTIATGGNVTEANVAMADLAGVNTGALVHYDNLTCSVNNNKYYLTDGTTTLQVYNTLFAFEALEAGKTYNITGVYQQYSDTKEILPRSAADIEEVQVQHDEYTLTIGNPDNITITANYDEEVLTNGEEAEILDGTEVTFVVNVATGYVLESVTVIDANQEAVSFTETSGAYTFNMPAVDVTINATAEEYVAPTPSNYVRISSLDDLTDGSVVIIAARHNLTADSYYAMKNATSGKPEGTLFTSATSEAGETVASTITDEEENYYWTVNVVDGSYTFTNASDNKIGYSGSSTDFQKDGNNTTWTIEKLTAGDKAMVPEYEGFVIKNGTTNTRAFAFNGSVFGAYATSNMNSGGYNFYLDFFVQTSEPAGNQLSITGYGEGAGNWYLVASPVTTTPEAAGMITDDGTDPENLSYDLYSFNQAQDLEWRNYRDQAFNLVPGTGYLYANKNNVTLTFAGEAYTGDGTVELTYDETADLAGWNLIGNPFAVEATLDHDFYALNNDGSGLGDLIASTTGTVNAMQGVFVLAQYNEETGEAEESVTFSTENNAKAVQQVVMNVTRNRGAAIDRAIVRFDEGQQLPKFQLNPENTKLYIAQGEKDYAIVRSAAQGEMPVSFRAAENGTYTLSVETENVEMDYLHLIDNLTGMDVDLLPLCKGGRGDSNNPQTASYTFEAKTTDYASRFRLVFSANSANEAVCEPSFAYFNGSEWVVSNTGDATLQVVDMMGRTLNSQTISGNAELSLDQPAGVYMLRLINGNDVKVQKVVVR